MTDPTRRALSLLALLQSRAVWSGPELAERLEVTTRSVRRDIERLRELGYPVSAARGAGGGYRLGAGRALPPLLLDDAETVAVAVSLSLAATGAIAGADEAAMRVLTKLDQLLPPRLRAELRALVEASDLLPAPSSPLAAELLMTLARSCRDRFRVRFEYADRSGAETDRTVEPVRLVVARHRWYLLAWDVARDDWRVFRTDRMRSVQQSTWRFAERSHPDPAGYVQRAVTSSPYRHQARIRLFAPLEEIQALVSPLVARLERIDDGVTELTAGSDDVGWLVWHVAGLGVPFRILEPPELRREAADLAARLRAAAEPGPDQG